MEQPLSAVELSLRAVPADSRPEAPPGTPGGAAGDPSGRAGAGGGSRPARRDGRRHWPGAAGRARPRPAPPPPCPQTSGAEARDSGRPSGPGSRRCGRPEGRKGQLRRRRKRGEAHLEETVTLGAGGILLME